MSRTPVALLGATGFTGGFAAEALDDSGVEFLLAGRRVERLKELSRRLESKPKVVKVDLSDPASVRDLARRCAAVASTAGPFLRLGPPVVEACVGAGTHYADTTGEPPFVKWVADQHARAQRSGAVLVPGMALLPGLGDLGASVAARKVKSPDEVEVRYAQWPASGRGFNMGRGTLRSLLELAGEPGWVLRDGRLVERRSLEVRPGGIEMPGCESLTVPRHLNVRSVRTVVSLPGLLRPASLLLSGLEIPLPSRGKGLAALADRLPGLSNPEADARVRVRVTAVVRGGGREESRARLSGKTVYRLSGRMVALAAATLAERPPPEAGFLAPSQALPATDFLKRVGVAIAES